MRWKNVIKLCIVAKLRAGKHFVGVLTNFMFGWEFSLPVAKFNNLEQCEISYLTTSSDHHIKSAWNN